MTKVLTDTNSSQLLQVSAGHVEILQQLTDEFRKQIQERFEVIEHETAKKAEDKATQKAATASAR